MLELMLLNIRIDIGNWVWCGVIAIISESVRTPALSLISLKLSYKNILIEILALILLFLNVILICDKSVPRVFNHSQRIKKKALHSKKISSYAHFKSNSCVLKSFQRV